MKFLYYYSLGGGRTGLTPEGDEPLSEKTCSKQRRTQLQSREWGSDMKYDFLPRLG
jgi:hypothetical protein